MFARVSRLFALSGTTVLAFFALLSVCALAFASAFGVEDLLFVLVPALGFLLVALCAQVTRSRTISYIELGQRLGQSRAGELPPVDPDSLGGAARLGRSLEQLNTALAQDLEQARSARESAEEVDRYEGEFLRTVSHELRTPLNAILGFAQILADELDGPLDASSQEDVETILSSASHLNALVGDVLDMAAMRSGQLELDARMVDVRPIVVDVARLLRGNIRNRPVEVFVDVPEREVMHELDPKRLRQILMNLGSNALKFTESGWVVFSLESEAEAISFSVSDTGPGIAQGELAQIFEEFIQVGVKRKTQGSGLGLAICRRLAEVHGGTIEVESEVGAGSTFKVTLPRPEEPSA